MRKSFYLVGVLAGVVSSNCFGFGQTGHRTVGEVASYHLSASAKKAIDEILDGEGLAFAATWPDEMRSSPENKEFWGYDAAANWHFINVNPGETYENSAKNPKGDSYVALNTFVAILENKTIPQGPVASALQKYFGDLTNPKKQKEIKKFALRFLVHIVGDMHQPLHAGYPSDLGGNKIKVKWFGKTTNLHKVWDEELVEEQHLGFTELTRKINNAKASAVKEIQKSKPIDWVHETIQIRTQAYDVDSFKGSFSYDYVYRFVPMIESQMFKGGLRAAALLNRIFK
ncbi:MAG: S1/P1 nuclease [Gammaproteobacteria bacterium]|nr:S1/P1 nuclease [Gammaproteobacteria bacterium]